MAVRSADDGRQMDAVAYGLTALPLCGDATLVSPLDFNGCPKYGADFNDGAALSAAARRKRRRYPELARGDCARLVLLECEVGGRWADEAWKLLWTLAAVRCEKVPELLKFSARMAWRRRWASIVSVAVQNAAAAALAEPPALATAAAPARVPEHEEVMGEDKSHAEPSRLAWRD